jgi:hypothetical protein
VDRLQLAGRILVVVAHRAEYPRFAEPGSDGGQDLRGARVVVEPLDLGHVQADGLEVAAPTKVEE